MDASTRHSQGRRGRDELWRKDRPSGVRRKMESTLKAQMLSRGYQAAGYQKGEVRFRSRKWHSGTSACSLLGDLSRAGRVPMGKG